MLQLTLAVLSLLALWMLTSDNALMRRWGSVMGLASQPFWLWATLDSEQYGIFFIACVYTARYAYCVRRDFYK